MTPEEFGRPWIAENMAEFEAAIRAQERERWRKVVEGLCEAFMRLGVARSDGSRCFCAATLLHTECKLAGEAIANARAEMEKP